MLPTKTLKVADLLEATSFDVVVIGAGGAGMTAALVAALEGCRVLVVESTAWVGGSTAFAAGTTWIPGTHLAQIALTRAGQTFDAASDLDEARRFLDAAVGPRSQATLRDAFLRHGPSLVRVLDEQTQVKFRVRRSRPDFLSTLPGWSANGRALEPRVFDARKLPPGDLDLIRRPPPEHMLLGGMMVDRRDVAQLTHAGITFAAFRKSVRLLTRYAVDRLMRHSRGTRLLRGNALVARLLASLREHGVDIVLKTRVAGLTRGPGGVTEVTLVQEGVTRRLRVQGGVVLATGGFLRNPAQRAARMPESELDWCAASPGNTGTAHAIAESVGAVYGTGAETHCTWAPVTLHTRRDGSVGTVAHFALDRSVPRVVAVNADGERFADESASHHAFALAMIEANRYAPTIPAYLITDAQGMDKYGLGIVRPRGFGLKAALASGAVVSASSLRELAAKLQIRAAHLTAAVTRFNVHWGDGEPSVSPVDDAPGDRHTGRSANEASSQALDWASEGAAEGPINEPPFYAVKVYPGDIGCATGFMADEHARALDAHGKPIAGLYVVGDDMHSIMGGVVPAPGCHLGPGMVFASLAARHAALRARLSAGVVAGSAAAATAPAATANAERKTPTH